MYEVLTVGDILKNTKLNTRYRVVDIDGEEVTLCQMDITALQLYMQTISNLIQMVTGGELVKEKEDSIVFDYCTLTEMARRKYDKKKTVVCEVLNLYHHSLLSLMGKNPKPELKEILYRNSMSVNMFWRAFTRYLQSGFQDFSLVDLRYLGANKGKKYEYTEKPGHKPEYFKTSGIVIDESVKQIFDEALQEFRSGRHKSLKSCYLSMSLLHFRKTEIINGVSSVSLLPESQRPTLRQFYYYADSQLTAQEKDAIKTSAQEQRNNKRLLTSDAMYDVHGPGDMVEIDACEADVSLVSAFDKNKTIGRPVVYFMIDVYSRIILAVSVAFDNNSVLGVTNLFLNLSDDKQEYCKKYGMGFDNPKIWPSNIIPRRIRLDRGSEFKSGEFDRICNELGIEKQIVPGASGSLKGIVEQSFHQMHVKQNMHLENYGLIKKRYDSNHHQEATLTIEEYNKMVINFVLTHNQEYNEKYPSTKEMIEKGIRPIPVLLWEYGIEKYGAPRPITSKKQYLYNLMTPVKAKINRRGITYKGLYYLPENDEVLAREMFKAGTKKQSFEVRMDMRDISFVYYLRDGKLLSAPLNEKMTGNGELKGMTMKQWEDYRKTKAQMDAEGRIYNQELAAFNYSVNAAIVKSAKKETMSDSKEMRPVREAEKQRISYNENIASRMGMEKEIPATPEISEVESKAKSFEKDYVDFNDALEDFMENN